MSESVQTVERQELRASLATILPTALFRVFDKMLSDLNDYEEKEAWTGCGTGDCPHTTTQDCADALVKALAGEISRAETLQAEVDHLQTADKLRSLSAMTRFRWHRGGFEESLKTWMPCASVPELVELLRNEFSFRDAAAINVAVSLYAFDTRLCADVYLVTVRGQPAGWADGIPTVSA